MRHEEWHVTVVGKTCPVDWYRWCHEEAHIKPLYIELNNFERQLMCAASFDPREAILNAGFKIIRIKHEVSALRPGEKALYWECHVKLDGAFEPTLQMSSRDLFRHYRWYTTRRQATPFNASDYAQSIIDLCGPITELEYEAAIFDSNPELDARWR